MILKPWSHFEEKFIIQFEDIKISSLKISSTDRWRDLPLKEVKEIGFWI